MANQLNTLYPPQVNTFMPAFALTATTGSGESQVTKANDAVVYYSLSPYNEASKIHYVHVSLVDQKTNDNAWTNPNGVLITEFNSSCYDADKGMYKVTIPNRYVKKIDPSAREDASNFKTNQFYKVQLRFDMSSSISVKGQGGAPVTYTVDDINDKGNAAKLGEYLIANRSMFSEWSSICLIRPISEPSISIQPFDLPDFDDSRPQGYHKGIIPVVGYVGFADAFESETMEYYQLQVLDEAGRKVVLETDRIFTGSSFDPNGINYKLDIQGIDTDASVDFTLRITVTTKNQFSMHKDYRFTVIDYIEDDYFDPQVEVEMDNEDAIAVVSVKNTASLKGVLYVKRSSSESDFRVWEDIYVKNVNGPVDFKVYDNTVCSMVWYRYSVQFQNVKRGMSQVVRSEKIFPDFYDAVLSRGSRQFAIRYNQVISSFRPVVNRSKVDTLGGKYPKFMENGAINYKQFTMTGLISSQEDPGQKFLDKRDAIGPNYDNYEMYKWDRNITEYYDYLWERDFREELMAWLNDGEPKLYRSQTEGNLCVILTDISLTPNKTLSRRIWDFSATVYEVAEGMSLADLHALGIYNIYADGRGGDGTLGGDAPTGPEDAPAETDEIWKVGQVYSYNVANKGRNFVSDVIGKRLEDRYGGYLKGRRPTELRIAAVRLFFQSKPHMYIQGANNTLIRINKEQYDLLGKANQAAKNQIVMGYRFQIPRAGSTDASQWDDILVDVRGYYEFPRDVVVSDIRFPDATVGPEETQDHWEDGYKAEYVTVEYVMIYKESDSEDSEVVSNAYVERTVIGQIDGTWEPNEYLSKQIRDKYSYRDKDSSRKMMSWKGVSVDVTPYALFNIRYADDDTYQTYMVGHGGYLALMQKFKVDDMCFLGVRMTKKPIERLPYLEGWEFVLFDGQVYGSVHDVPSPERNGVYVVGGRHMIYYRDEWYPFELGSDGTGVAPVPVSGAVNYLGDVVRSMF